MIKCCTPVVVLGLSLWLKYLPFCWEMIVVISGLSAGMFLAVTGGDVNVIRRPDFPMNGALCAAVATLLAGLRTVLAQRVLHGHAVDDQARRINTVTLLYYATPASALSLVIPAAVFEYDNVLRYIASHSAKNNVEVVLCILISSAIAFFLSLSEYLLTLHTSALTMAVSSIAKQLFVIAAAMIFFREHLGGMNLVGVAVTTMGIAYYNYIKYNKMAALSRRSDDRDDGSSCASGVEALPLKS
jgi:solute carrier family 35 protein C2